MELEKVAKIDLEEEAYLKPISDRGIGFYNLDKNTAQFQFRVTKNDKPLLISDKNVKGYAFFKAMNGTESQRPSISGVLDVDFIDPMRGLIGVTVPGWFLRSVANSEVLGEVYLSLNDYNNLGKDDTVVLGTFSFTVRDSLVNQIDSDIKVSYIRMFDELRTEIESKVQELKQEISNSTDLVSEVNQVVENAQSKVIQIRNESISAIDTAKSDAVNTITSTKDNAIRDIEATKSLVIGDYEVINTKIQQTIGNAKDEFETKSNNANQTIDDKIAQFNQTLQTDGFTTSDEVDNKINDLDWQRYKLTNDKGAYQSIELNNDLEQLHSLAPGNYYVSHNVISNATSSHGFLRVEFRDNDLVKRITFMPHNSNEIWLKRYYNSWSDWERVNTASSDTGWIELSLVNGATPNTEYSDRNGFRCAYRIIKSGNATRTHLRLNASNLISGQVFAVLPKEIVNNAQSFSVRTPTNKPGCFIVINPSGEVVFLKSTVTGDWLNTDYIYAEVSWLD